VRNAGLACAVDSCSNDANCRGWCKMHYSRWRINGDPLKVKKPHKVPVNADGTITCLMCRADRFESEYPRDKAGRLNRSQCRDCRNDTRRISNYGLRRGEYAELVDRQGGLCALCFRTPDHTSKNVLVVDHCHRTGINRQLLCGYCNSGLGYFQDDPDRLHAAAIYSLQTVDVLGGMLRALEAI
jgi:recombination endonuclease VII